MRFGNCVDLIAAARNNSPTIARMKAAKFDYIEASLQSIARATEEELAAAKALADRYELPVPVCNGMFPGDVRLVADERNDDAIRAYVDDAFRRASVLGVKKVVLGSDKARQLPDGYDMDTAYEEFIDMIKKCVVPYCEQYGITVVIEPLRNPPCNFINTLPDGMRIVRGVNSPWVQLLADSIHMMSSGEDPAYVHEVRDCLQHVHVSDWDRALPEFGYSSELTAVLREIKKSGYDGDFSFEARVGSGETCLHRALLTLRAKLR